MGGSCAQSCLTLWLPMDCSPPCSSVHRISQAGILEWVATSCSRGSSQLSDQTNISCVSSIGRQILYHCTPGKPPLLFTTINNIINFLISCLYKCIMVILLVNPLNLKPKVSLSADHIFLAEKKCPWVYHLAYILFPLSWRYLILS